MPLPNRPAPSHIASFRPPGDPFGLLERYTFVTSKKQIMESTRQAKICRLLQKEISEIFRQQTAKTHGTIVSVSAVRVSPDLSIAKVYLSVFPSDKAQDVLQGAKEQMKTIRYELAQKVRYQLRKVPELAFYLDDSLDYLENIDRLLKTDEKPGE